MGELQSWLSCVLYTVNFFFFFLLLIRFVPLIWQSNRDCNDTQTIYIFLDFRNNSIACLRAKAQEHQQRLMTYESGLLALQVRSLAGLQHHKLPSPISSSPKSCDSTMIHQHSPTPSPIRSPENNNNNHTSRNFNSNMAPSSDMSEDIDIEDVKPIHKTNISPNVVTFWWN